MTWTITVAGDPQTVPAEDGETILDALLRHGVGFAYSCQAGNCGTCKCEYVSGEIMELEYSEHALSAPERARGTVLACRTQVWGDVQIRRLSAEEFIMHPSRVMHCRVVELTHLTHDIVRLRMTVEQGGPYTFSAGQFAKLAFAFAPAILRDYSMASRPDEAVLEFHVRAVPGGVSERIPHELHVGDRVQVSGPFGTSYLREQHPGRIIAVAGSTGLAPIRSIAARALQLDPLRSIQLYFGARSERDLYGERELVDWQQAYPNLEVHIVLSDERAPGRRHGMVTDAVAQDIANAADCQAYLAGPPAMVDAAAELLKARGAEPRNIHADAFYPADPVKEPA